VPEPSPRLFPLRAIFRRCGDLRAPSEVP
jgi:hypothetical protein